MSAMLTSSASKGRTRATLPKAALALLAICTWACAGQELPKTDQADGATSSDTAMDADSSLADDDAPSVADNVEPADGDDGVGLADCVSASDCPAATESCQQAACSGGTCAIWPAAAASTCDDGEVCTSGDHCEAGSCVSGTYVCACQTDADCLFHEDDNACNGTLICAAASKACVVDPATVVTCPQPIDNVCVKSICAHSTGQCDLKQADGALCEDGNPCTASDTCEGGQCAGTTVCVCESDADCASKDDGNPCNGTLYCDLASAVHACKPNPLTVIDCPAAEDTTCLKNSCDPISGSCEMKAVGLIVACDDGDPCTVGEICDQGACVGTSVCACQTDADCAAKDDGDLCNGTLACDNAVAPYLCKPAAGSAIDCGHDGEGPCKKQDCDAKTGGCALKALPDGSACDDGEPCSHGDQCAAAQCVAGVKICQCKVDADCAAFDDGDACNGTLVCDTLASPHLCVVDPATIKGCPSDGDTDCIKNTCQTKSGACEMAPLSCVDDALCTLDSCEEGVGCKHLAAPDGLVCGSGKVCKAGACVVKAD